MNSFDYSLLIKEVSAHNKVAKLARVRVIIFWLLAIFSIIFLLINNGIDKFNDIATIISSIIFLSIAVAAVVYQIWFYMYVDRLRKLQSFSNDEIDDTFIELNKKYTIHNTRVKKALLITIILGVVLFIASMIFLFVGIELAPEPIEESMNTYLILSIIGFITLFADILISTLMIVFKQITFANKAVKEIELIKQYFYTQQGLTKEQINKKKHNIFTNVYDGEKILTYMFPDEKIRHSIRRLSILIIIPALVSGFLLGFAIVFAIIIPDSALLTLMLIIGGVLLVGSLTTYYVRYYKLFNNQRKIFNTDRDKYKYYLELADETKIYQTKSNLFSLVVTLIFIIIGVLVGFLVQLTTEEVIGFIFLSVIIWIIALIAFLIVSYRKYRIKAKLIEIKINEHQLREVFTE